jgi:hypothetical protein
MGRFQYRKQDSLKTLGLVIVFLNSIHRVRYLSRR